MSGIKKFTVNGTDASIAMASDSTAGFMSSEQYTFIEGIRGTGEEGGSIDASIIKYDNKTTGMDPVFDASTMESVGWTSGKPVTVDTAIDVLAKKQADLETDLSGLMFDVSEANGREPFDTLSDALTYADSVLLASQKKGGMTIKYVQSSDNKYVQFRLMAQSFTTDTTQWSIAEEGVYVENPEFVYVKTDVEGKILWAIKTDGGIYYGAGCPQQVKDYIEEKIADLSLDEYEDIVTFLSDYLGSDTTLKAIIDGINAQIATKVDKVEGKSLIDAEYASTKGSTYNNDYLEVVVDNDNKIIEGIKSDGTKEVNTPIELNGGMTVQGNKVSTIENQDYIEAKVDSHGRILEAITTNGEKHISKFDDSTKNLIKNITGGDTVGGNYISIPLLDANFASPVPVEIIGTKGSDDAQYIFDLPLSEDAFNIRFEFRITENLLNQNKNAVIAKLGSSNIIGATVQSLAQQTSSYTVDGVTKTSYWPSFTGGIRLNGGQVGGKSTDHNIGLFAFCVKYIGSSEDVTISNSGTAITISVDGNDTEFLFSNYPTVSELYEAIKAMQDIEVSFNELEGRNSDELAVFPATKLVSSYYSTLNGGRSESDVEVEYVDAAPLFIPYAISNKWHRVEVAKIGDTVYVSCNGDVSTISNIGSNLLTLGGSCGVQFRNLEIYVNSSYDAEVVDGMLISSMTPYIIVYECHGMDKTPSCESATTGNLNGNVDRFQHVFSYAKSKGYVPVSIVDIADYYSGDKKLPKRCFTTVFDGYRFANVMDLENRAVFTRLNALSSLAIATSEEEPIIHDGTTITEDVAAKICRNNGFELISHSCDHRHFNGVKPSTYIEHFSEDIYSADLLNVIGNIIVFPFGDNNLYILDTMKWMGFRLGIGVYASTTARNTYSRSKYLLTRYEIGMRVSLETVMTATR